MDTIDMDNIRRYSDLRGPESKEQRYHGLMKRVSDLYESILCDDIVSFDTDIGEVMMSLILLADTENIKAEQSLEKLFRKKQYMKGLNKGSFVEYQDLPHRYRKICDMKQGSEGSKYFEHDLLDKLTPPDFELE